MSEWAAFLTKDPYDSGVHVDNEGNGTVWIEQIERPPPTLGVLFGEYFYNLRTALDYCVYDVAIHDSKSNPPPNETSLQFPIYSNPDTWTKNEYRIKPLSEEHRGWLKAIQPCFRRDERPRMDSLDWLNRLANRDRHRQLHVVGGYISESSPVVYVSDPAASVFFEDVDPSAFVEDYAEVARFKVVPHTPENKVEANPNTALDIEIEEMVRERVPEMEWLYWPLRQRLFIIEAYVDAIIGRFENSCTGRTRSKFFGRQRDERFAKELDVNGPTE